MGESSFLLPAGSRIESFGASDLQSGVNCRRRRKTSRIFTGAAAVLAACAMVVVAMERSSLLGETVALEEYAGPGLRGEDPLAGKKLPSWLQTGDVAVTSLKTLERAAIEKLSNKEQLAEKEQPDSHMTPKQLALRNVHKKAAEIKEGNVAHEAAPVTVHHVEEHHHINTEKTTAAKKEITTHKKNVIDGGMLKNDENELQAVKAAEASEEAKVKKAELHKLAKMRKAASAEESKLETKIKNIKEERKEAEEHSEKIAIKAEMAKIEADEAKKLATLKAKLASVGSDGDKSDKKGASASKDVATKHVAEAHAAASSPAHNDGEESKVKAALASAKEAGQTPQHKAHKCTEKDCAIKAEDNKWISDTDKVGHELKSAMHGSGKEREEAIKKIGSLQAEISSDFQHVTKYGKAQKVHFSRKLPAFPHA